MEIYKNKGSCSSDLPALTISHFPIVSHSFSHYYHDKCLLSSGIIFPFLRIFLLDLLFRSIFINGMLLNDTKGKNFGRAFNESEMFQFQSEILFFYLTAFLSFSCLLKIFDRLKKLNTSEYFT